MKDYEEKYKQALERAKDMLSYNEVRQEDMEYLFPELKEKESEDERIRKGLINGFKECLEDCQYPKNAVKYWHNVEVDNILAWLEKQGEQKQTWEPSAAQLIVIKDLIEDKNTSKVNKVILRGMFDEIKQFTNNHKRKIDDYECKNSRNQD